MINLDAIINVVIKLAPAPIENNRPEYATPPESAPDRDDVGLFFFTLASVIL